MTDLQDHEVDVEFEPDDEYEPVEGAHIIYPWVEVGEKALTLCGVKHKVEMDWFDIPPDYPICRDCVDESVRLLSDATRMLVRATTLAAATSEAAGDLNAHLLGPSDLFDTLTQAVEYNDKQEEKAIAKAEKKAQKKEQKKGKGKDQKKD